MRKLNEKDVEAIASIYMFTAHNSLNRVTDGKFTKKEVIAVMEKMLEMYKKEPFSKTDRHHTKGFNFNLFANASFVSSLTMLPGDD